MILDNSFFFQPRLISSIEDIKVTVKARMTKLEATQPEPCEPGKASTVKSAKRSADGKPKIVIPDSEDEDATRAAAAAASEDNVRFFFPFAAPSRREIKIRRYQG